MILRRDVLVAIEEVQQFEKFSFLSLKRSPYSLRRPKRNEAMAIIEQCR
jgi:hypothetical protein